MTEISDEMMRAYGDARAALNQEQMYGRPPISEEAKTRAGIAAAIAVAGRDLAGYLRALAAAKRISVEHLRGLGHPTCALRLNEARGLDEAVVMVERALGVEA